jgi:hypothetical protein
LIPDFTDRGSLFTDHRFLGRSPFTVRGFKMATETYVVSVYRRSSEPGKEIAGLAERPGSGERKAFANSQELWAFLCASSKGAEVKKARKPRALK